MCIKIAQNISNGFKMLVEKYADMDYFVIKLSIIYAYSNITNV